MNKAGESYTKEDIEGMKRTFQAELQRKDEEIERLRKENIVLLRTALKKAEKSID